MRLNLLCFGFGSMISQSTQSTQLPQSTSLTQGFRRDSVSNISNSSQGALSIPVFNSTGITVETGYSAADLYRFFNSKDPFSRTMTSKILPLSVKETLRTLASEMFFSDASVIDRSSYLLFDMNTIRNGENSSDIHAIDKVFLSNPDHLATSDDLECFRLFLRLVSPQKRLYFGLVAMFNPDVSDVFKSRFPNLDVYQYIIENYDRFSAREIVDYVCQQILDGKVLDIELLHVAFKVACEPTLEFLRYNKDNANQIDTLSGMVESLGPRLDKKLHDTLFSWENREDLTITLNRKVRFRRQNEDAMFRLTEPVVGSNSKRFSGLVQGFLLHKINESPFCLNDFQYQINDFLKEFFQISVGNGVLMLDEQTFAHFFLESVLSRSFGTDFVKSLKERYSWDLCTLFFCSSEKFSKLLRPVFDGLPQDTTGLIGHGSHPSQLELKLNASSQLKSFLIMRSSLDIYVDKTINNEDDPSKCSLLKPLGNFVGFLDKYFVHQRIKSSFLESYVIRELKFIQGIRKLLGVQLDVFLPIIMSTNYRRVDFNRTLSLAIRSLEPDFKLYTRLIELSNNNRVREMVLLFESELKNGRCPDVNNFLRFLDDSLPRKQDYFAYNDLKFLDKHLVSGGYAWGENTFPMPSNECVQPIPGKLKFKGITPKSKDQEWKRNTSYADPQEFCKQYQIGNHTFDTIAQSEALQYVQSTIFFHPDHVPFSIRLFSSRFYDTDNMAFKKVRNNDPRSLYAKAAYCPVQFFKAVCLIWKSQNVNNSHSCPHWDRSEFMGRSKRAKFYKSGLRGGEDPSLELEYVSSIILMVLSVGSVCMFLNKINTSNYFLRCFSSSHTEGPLSSKFKSK